METKLLNEKLYNFYYSSNFAREIKSMRTVWAGHVARVKLEKHSTFCLEISREEKTGEGLTRRWENK
jgi:hypothetical protein